MRDLIPRGAAPVVLGDRQCTARSRSGERCRRAAIPGGFVCAMHGGRSPLAQTAARERLARLAEPALDVLYDVLDGPKCEACGRVRDQYLALKAAITVLDRTGFGPSATLKVSQTTSEWDPFIHAITDDEMDAIADILEGARQRILAEGQQPKLPIIEGISYGEAEVEATNGE